MCEQREAQTSNVKLPLHPATHFPALLGHAMSDYRRERQNDGRINRPRLALDTRWGCSGTALTTCSAEAVAYFASARATGLPAP